MKYTYAFATGSSQVEVPEEWAELLAEMDHEEELHNRRETRRHQSLDDLVYEGLDFAAEGDAETPLMENEFSLLLTEAVRHLPDSQRKRLNLRCKGKTYTQIGLEENISRQKATISVEKAIKNLKKILEGEGAF